MKLSTVVTWAALAYLIYELSNSAAAAQSQTYGPCGVNVPMAQPLHNPVWMNQLANATEAGKLIFGGLS